MKKHLSALFTAIIFSAWAHVFFWQFWLLILTTLIPPLRKTAAISYLPLALTAVTFYRIFRFEIRVNS